MVPLQAIAIIATASLLASAVAHAAGGGPSSELRVPGELHKGSSMPPSAIDTRDIPTIVLEPGDDEDDPLPFYELTGDTYLLYGNIDQVDEGNRGFMGNAGFVVTEEGVVAIDTLGTPELGARMIATIRTVTDKPISHLILTHNHPDHYYGAAAFRRQAADIEVVAHANLKDYVGGSTMEESVAYRRDVLGEDMDGFKAVRPDVTVDGDLYSKRRLEVGDKSFDVYNVGGHHSHGDLVIHQVEDEIVWISDLAFNQRVTFMGDGDIELALKGQDWLREHFADVKLMIPGHGSAQTPPFPMVDKTHAYMTKLRDEMRQAVKNGVSLYEAVQQTHFPEWQDVRLYEENHRSNANFAYRQMEQAFFFGE